VSCSSSPIFINDIVILVTGYLGIPVTDHSILKNKNQRFAATSHALRELRKNSGNIRILLAFTGDSSAFNLIVTECGWPDTDAAIFPQTAESSPFGKGLLEHQLICRALRYWELSDQNKLVIKLTAKYSIENLDDVVDFAARSNYPMYGWMHLGKSMVDSRCFFFRSAAYTDFCYILDRIDDRQNYYFEHALYNILSMLNIKPGLMYSRPIISGLSGSSGEFVRMAVWKRYLIWLASHIKF
jgi:hypothetical protein